LAMSTSSACAGSSCSRLTSDSDRPIAAQFVFESFRTYGFSVFSTPRMFPQQKFEWASDSPSEECCPVPGSPRSAPRGTIALVLCLVPIGRESLESRDVLFQVVDAFEKLVRAFSRAQRSTLTQDTQYPVQVLTLAVQLFPESPQLGVLHARSPSLNSKSSLIRH